jgi:ubiquinone/menaquinone biosynthesis C-methylase UbiE
MRQLCFITIKSACFYAKRLWKWLGRIIHANINKRNRMKRHPQTHGNRSRGIYVDKPLPLATYELEKLKRKMKVMPEAFRREALSLGRFFEGRNGLEQLDSLGLHGMRYWLVSQLVKNYVSAKGAPTGAGYRTLEVGCNTGWTSVLIKLACKDIEVSAMDIEEPLLRLGQVLEKNLGAGPINWITGDGMRLKNQPDLQTFDIIMLCEILERFGSPEEHMKLLSQAVSVCRPGGWIVVSVPFEDRIPAPGEYLSVFDKNRLTKLVEPYAADLLWLAEERVRYILDRHFFLLFTPKLKFGEC